MAVQTFNEQINGKLKSFHMLEIRQISIVNKEEVIIGRKSDELDVDILKEFLARFLYLLNTLLLLL